MQIGKILNRTNLFSLKHLKEIIFWGFSFAFIFINEGIVDSMIRIIQKCHHVQFCSTEQWRFTENIGLNIGGPARNDRKRKH